MADKERSVPTGAIEPNIGNADIWSDGTETDSDRKIREFTLAELEKSKKSLPKERYDALVRAVGDILRGHYEKEEEVRDDVRAKIAEFKGEVSERKESGGREPSCIRHKFDPAKINGAETERYFTEISDNPEKFAGFVGKLEADQEMMAGFLRFWELQKIPGEMSGKSNVRDLLANEKKENVIRKMGEYHQKVLRSYGMKLTEKDLSLQGDVEKGGKKTDRIIVKLNRISVTTQDGKEVQEENKEFYNTPKSRENFKKFVNGDSSLSSLDNKVVGDILSYVYVNSYDVKFKGEKDTGAIAAFKEKMARDTDGLLHISKNWGKRHADGEKPIDQLMVISATKAVNIVKDIREAFTWAMKARVERFASNFPVENKKALSNDLQTAIDAVKVENGDYFENVGRAIEAVMKKHGQETSSKSDVLQFVIRILQLKGGEYAMKSQQILAENPWLGVEMDAVSACKAKDELKVVEENIKKKFANDKEKLQILVTHVRQREAELQLGKVVGKIEDAGVKAGTEGQEGRVSEQLAKFIGMAACSEKPAEDENIFKKIKVANRLRNEQDLLESAGLPKGKFVEDLRENELRAVIARLEETKDGDPRRAEAIGDLKKLIELIPQADREFVAVVRGISISDVRKLEERGYDLSALAQEGMKGPVFGMGKPKIDERTSTVTKEGATGGLPNERRWGLDGLEIGSTVRLGIWENSDAVTVTKTSDAANPYRISVGGRPAYECSDKNLDAHLEMAKLLCENGLEFLGGVSSEMLKIASVRKGDLATAQDGEFTDREKRVMLIAYAEAFGIEGFPAEATELREMESYLRTHAADRGTSLRELGIRSKALDENGNVRNREVLLARLK